MVFLEYRIPYAHHHNPLLITNRSLIQAIHKDRIVLKNLLLVSQKVGKKYDKTVAYNGACTLVVSTKAVTNQNVFFCCTQMTQIKKKTY